ncbi:MAG: type VI secretion system ATPase TssH, partial [Alcaligenes aquatilis]
GRLIDFSNTVIFLTSNLATDIVTAARAETPPPQTDELAERIRPTLSQHFKPALLARMTVVPYGTLSDEALAQIVQIKLARIVQRLQVSNGLSLEFTPAVAQAIAARCTEVDSGARNIDFILRKSLLPALSDRVLAWMADGDGSTALSVDVGPQASQPWVIRMGS